MSVGATTLVVGDKLTTVVSWFDPATGACAEGCVVRTTVAEVVPEDGENRGCFLWRGGELFLPGGTTVDVDILGTYHPDDEGVTWVHGWPPLDDEAVQALVVAHTFEPGAVPSRLCTEHSSPGIDVYSWRWDLDGYLDDDFEARGLVR